MADEKDASSSLMAKVTITESSEVPSEVMETSESKSSMNTKSEDGENEEDITLEGEDTQLQAVEAANVLDDISEEDDEDDTNLVVLDPNHVSI